ncbi:hypothetical protein L917_09626 [Phytophthora nicotianae]|uniref:Uncharacterized protein n=1 Tax=Phytophthora nicotianae TaxID=4792 RepID=W2L505_PHYNI|nr:hypothetical protein L917_09626 [Phytophthora nicotianae]
MVSSEPCAQVVEKAARESSAGLAGDRLRSGRHHRGTRGGLRHHRSGGGFDGAEAGLRSSRRCVVHVSADINSMSDIFSVDEEDLVQISMEPKFADVGMSVTDSVDSIVSSDVTAEDVLSAIDAVQGFTELNILVSDVVVTTAEPLDGVVVATDIVAVTEVIALSGEDLPIAVSFLDADAATRQDLLNRLRKSTVSKACFAYYALIDDEFCIEMIRLHRLGKSRNFHNPVLGTGFWKDRH